MSVTTAPFLAAFRPAANPSIVQAQAPGGAPRAHVIVFGNEKGGSGKSTAAMHIAVALLREGARVGVIDVDARQGTLTRYVENRRTWANAKGLATPLPDHRAVLPSTLSVRSDIEADERQRLDAAFADLLPTCDYLVADTPGSDTFLSRHAHTYADTLVTPLNDSFVDLDLLARVDPETLKVVRPSIYAETVWKQRQLRAMSGGRPVDWLVMRNRLSAIAARNKRDMGTVLESLAKRIGYRLAAGLAERVIYRELFLKGLTLLDLREEKTGIAMTMSHVAARQEVRDLLAALNLPLRVEVEQKTDAEPTDQSSPSDPADESADAG
ncbi:division plane positioning ATPase MipZ [Reyranella sp. CPCC 100927]|uniref:division plane positioning ATPase MipZ n=1 Tax=Reyranella sp. CPCC 100927 TaxID=2599616 RepID=UPI0011B381F6|nr:division plane positioning ATPase MipZ [Reyranella sp. CPCC 100927]TWS98520.1 AAA family ATPase [Reyranella sp. CPCC 100927]